VSRLISAGPQRVTPSCRRIRKTTPPGKAQVHDQRQRPRSCPTPSFSRAFLSWTQIRDVTAQQQHERRSRPLANWLPRKVVMNMSSAGTSSRRCPARPSRRRVKDLQADVTETMLRSGSGPSSAGCPGRAATRLRPPPLRPPGAPRESVRPARYKAIVYRHLRRAR